MYQLRAPGRNMRLLDSPELGRPHEEGSERYGVGIWSLEHRKQSALRDAVVRPRCTLSYSSGGPATRQAVWTYTISFGYFCSYFKSFGHRSRAGPHEPGTVPARCHCRGAVRTEHLRSEYTWTWRIGFLGRSPVSRGGRLSVACRVQHGEP